MGFFSKKRTVLRGSQRAWLLVLSLAIWYTSPGIASAASYWSLGSFRSEANALQERDRIASMTGLAVDVAKSRDLYRVIVEKDRDPDRQKALLEGLGITPWTISDEDLDTVVEEREPERPEAIPPRAAPIAPVEPPAPELPVAVGERPTRTTADMATRPASPVTRIAKGEQYLVVASFVDLPSAEMLMARLADDGIGPLAIAASVVNDVTYHRVVQGPFASRSGVREDFSGYGVLRTWWLNVDTIGLDNVAIVRTMQPSAASVAKALARAQQAANARAAAGQRSRDRRAAAAGVRTREAVGVAQRSGTTAPGPVIRNPEVAYAEGVTERAERTASERIAVEEPTATMDEPVYTLSPPRPTESYMDYCIRRANAMERAVFCKNGSLLRASTIQEWAPNSKDQTLIFCALHASGEEREKRCGK